MCGNFKDGSVWDTPVQQAASPKQKLNTENQMTFTAGVGSDHYIHTNMHMYIILCDSIVPGLVRRVTASPCSKLQQQYQII